MAQKSASVALSGVMGSKALLVVNGSAKTMGVGELHAGVKLVSVSAQDAVVEVDGKRVQLSLGGTHVNLGGSGSEASGSRIVLTAGSGGHFITRGTINGKSVQFLVDTGATSVAMSQAEAERIGLKYKDGQMGISNTANGQVMMYRTKLSSVRINDVQVFDVDAAVQCDGLGHRSVAESRVGNVADEGDRRVAGDVGTEHGCRSSRCR